MTRKDYQRIANAISVYCEGTDSAMRLDTVEDIVEILVDIFTEDNPAFQPARFRKACR